jgi:predicted nucleic acid-binding protein
MNTLCEPPLTTLSRPLVLDSNVVLDVWLFDDPRVARLRASIEDGRAQWLASTAVLDEIAHVLSYGLKGQIERVSANKESVLSACRRWAQVSAASVPLAPHHLRCTDADDQKFIDLALTLAPAWLLSRDKAVLRLAKRAAGLGVHIATPERWLALTQASSA